MTLEPNLDIPQEKISELCRRHRIVELAEIFGRRVDLATKRWLKPKVRAEVPREARVVYAA